MKWFGWLCKTIISTTIITTVSIAVTWSMVNIYVQQLISPFQGEGQMALRPVALTDLISFMVAQSANTGSNRAEPERAEATDTAEPPGESVETEELPSGNDVKEAVPEDALPVMGNVQSVHSSDAEFISTDELDEKKDSISPEDRAEIFSMMVSRLPPEEMQNLSKLLEGGITSEEIQEASTILKEHLNEQEYEKLIAILTKY